MITAPQIAVLKQGVEITRLALAPAYTGSEDDSEILCAQIDIDAYSSNNYSGVQYVSLLSETGFDRIETVHIRCSSGALSIANLGWADWKLATETASFSARLLLGKGAGDITPRNFEGTLMQVGAEDQLAFYGDMTTEDCLGTLTVYGYPPAS